MGITSITARLEQSFARGADYGVGLPELTLTVKGAISQKLTEAMDVDADAYKPLLTGGIYGPQASICATVILLAAIGAALALKPRDPAPVQEPEQNERPANFL